MEISYENQNLILLPRNHWISKLYSLHIHQISNSGVAATVAKIRLRFWICDLAKIVKAIRFRCVLCRKLNKLCASQRVAPLPKERLRPCLPWQYTSVDLFGPYTIKGEVNKRCRGKAYSLIFNYCVSRAVYVDIAADYSTAFNHNRSHRWSRWLRLIYSFDCFVSALE